jgi:hypothetical protein
MFKRFYEKPVYTEIPRLLLNQVFNLIMPLRNYSYESLTIPNPPDFFFFLPEIPPPLKQ